MHVTASGLVHDARQARPHQRSTAFSDIVITGDGTVLVSFRAGSARDSLDGHILLYAGNGLDGTWDLVYDGTDKGNWEDGTPGEVKTFSIVETRPGLLTATGLWVDRSDPSLPFVNPRNQGILPMRIFHTDSTDGGRTWSPRRLMDVRPHRGASPVTEAIYTLTDGVLAQPYETWKDFDDDGPPDQGAYLRLSRDGGSTWPEFATMARHPIGGKYYWDVRVARHPETGRQVGTYWTHDSTLGMDIDIHISWGAPDGMSWTEPVGTGISGQHCMPIPLGGDRVLFVYPDRRVINGIGASLSDDFGETWDAAPQLTVYRSEEGTESGAHGRRSQREMWNDMGSWRFGHPRGVVLGNGEVLVVFYAGDGEYLDIRWARIAAS